MRWGRAFQLGKSGKTGAVFLWAVHTFVPICVLELLFLLRISSENCGFQGLVARTGIEPVFQP